MSERAAMKRRVRGLLRGNWLAPLGALVLAGLPMIIVTALVTWLLLPRDGGLLSLPIAFQTDDPRLMLQQLLLLFSNPDTLLGPMLGWLPSSGIHLAVNLFIGMPIAVSLSGYFLGFLRGKKPAILDVYGCFSGRYPRYLGGMAYRFLWQFIWAVAAFVLPTVLIFGAIPLVSMLGIELVHQLYAFGITLVVCLVWYIVFFFIYLNRCLAYCLTPICLAAQPRLPAHRAVRLSRKLMRGSKWRLIGLFLSFMNYFLPAIVAIILLPLLSIFGTSLGITEIMQQSLTIFLWVIIGLNQLVWLYVAPYMCACFNAFYIERKREALMDEEVSPDDFGSKPKTDTQWSDTQSHAKQR